ncbi:MAG: hypothetical protein ABSC47_06215 [Terracidiphilus sp.]
MVQRIAGGIGIAILLVTAGIAVAQNPTTAVPLPAPNEQMAIPNGYSAHGSVDVGGHIAGITGSGAMYDTLVNMQTGPRALGETFEMRALPGQKHTLFDTLRAVGTGFGGDPNSFTKLDFSKGKIYEFSGLFRRDRQYFDYDLLGNPNILPGLSIPYGETSGVPTSASLAWPQVKQSPVMFNTVRRMTDTNLTILPLSKVTFRAGYSQNIFQGPTLSPGESVGKYDSLLSEYQRNSTDDFTGGIDWKPVQGTKLTFEEEVDHYKANSYFTLAPGDFIAQEADGTPVSLGDWDSQAAYGIGACITGSMGSSAYHNSTNYTIFSAPTNGSLPIINPACDVVTSYLRSQPTRILYPTEIFRLQSASIKNISMNGDFRYTSANMNLPNYYENFQGLDGQSATKAGVTPPYPAQAARSATFTGSATAKREVLSADYGIVWQATKTVSLSDQIDYSNFHQPGTSNISAGITANTPTNPNETINYSGPLGLGVNLTVGGSPNGTPSPAYFGQRFLTNNLTGTWDASSRATLSLTYRYRTHVIAENAYGAGPPVDPGGNPGNNPLAVGADTNGTVTINENGGIFNAALRPANNWDVNGTVEILYDDNAFTPLGPRQTKHYRVHTVYKPKSWATISGAYNDLERHNNTNNNQSAVTAGDDPYEGPLNHVDYSRIVSLGAVLSPNEHYGIDLNYAYSDVYAATNICYDNGAQNSSTAPPQGLPGTASLTSGGAPNVCPGVYIRNSTTQLADWFARDFMSAPTQYGSVALSMSPVDKIHSNIGYRISAVNGSQFFNDARSVNGSLQSAYQSPYLNLGWTVRPGLILKAEYNFYGYGEGGPSGPQFCSTSTSTTSTVVPCTPLPQPTGLTEPPSGLTAPRNFHANNVTLGMHYEF